MLKCRSADLWRKILKPYAGTNHEGVGTHRGLQEHPHPVRTDVLLGAQDDTTFATKNEKHI